MFYDQSEFDIRQEWGLRGVEVLAPISDVVIVVDVLSFSTCVDVAVGRGAAVYPCRWRDESAGEYAEAVEAILALPHRVAAGGYSLSPTSLMGIPEGTRLVLPSPNGSTLTLAAGGTVTLAGCLRNARVVAEAAQGLRERIGVIAAGERWPDGSLRAAVEDLLGAGAIIHYLAGKKSPEAVVAEAAFVRVKEDLPGWLTQCSSGKELVERGFAGDVELAAELNASECVPILRDRAYVRLAHSS
ncbi:MAG TPA: 2-phosphosulfolactate phosphatase [Chloroflexia bacterium]|jgi:2-phosphosulfolactate phosphatase